MSNNTTVTADVKPKKRGRPAKSEGEKDVRARVWDFLIYPESAPPDWRDKLRELKCEGVIGPLHDKDVTPTGEPKKAHHHVVLYFVGKKSWSQVKAITDSLHQPIPLVGQSLRGSVRYLTHCDYPDKAQYSRADIEELCGFDSSIYFAYRAFEIQQVTIQIEEFIDEHEITEYCDLSRALRYEHLDWYDVLTTQRSLHFRSYLSSTRNSGFKRRMKDLIVGGDDRG